MQDSLYPALRNFNPRSCERSDRKTLEMLILISISIHAPARGATISKEIRDKDNRFQSTLLREERQKMPADVRTLIEFQSTLLREERLKLYADKGYQLHFNPRSCERSDTFWYTPERHSKNFNPRSCERSDHVPINSTCIDYLFQSTLLREERLNIFYFLSFTYYFNPRSCERSDFLLRL